MIVALRKIVSAASTFNPHMIVKSLPFSQRTTPLSLSTRKGNIVARNNTSAHFEVILVVLVLCLPKSVSHIVLGLLPLFSTAAMHFVLVCISDVLCFLFVFGRF